MSLHMLFLFYFPYFTWLNDTCASGLRGISLGWSGVGGWGAVLGSNELSHILLLTAPTVLHVSQIKILMWLNWNCSFNSLSFLLNSKLSCTRNVFHLFVFPFLALGSGLGPNRCLLNGAVTWCVHHQGVWERAWWVFLQLNSALGLQFCSYTKALVHNLK